MARLVYFLMFLSIFAFLYMAWDLALGDPVKSGVDVAKRPNIVLILTDDQDLHMNSMEYMPLTRKLIADQGTEFRNHFCTNALCCPSRVTLWTGKSPHNHNVTDVNPPHGGYPKFVSQGFNDDYLPLWLQAAGYNTYYVGKLFNAQKVTNYDKPHAAGFTGSDFLLDPFTYEYMNATFQRNRDPPVSYEGQYSTDVLASKAYAFLDDAVKASKPFMLTIAPVAPHSNVHILDKNIHGNYSGASAIQSPPVPAERHKHLFQDARVPRNAAFNPDVPSGGAAWISHLPQQNESNLAYNDEWYRNRLRSLQSVDEIVAETVSKLESHGILEETYVIFTTDNGYHIGQHRLQPGKQCSYKEDINIPFMIRGPGVPKSHVSRAVTSHTDLAATFLRIAGVGGREGLDGEAIPLTEGEMLEVEVEGEVKAGGKSDEIGSGSELGQQERQRQRHRRRRQEHVSIEMWGIIMSEGKFGADLHHNHTYKTLRVVGDEFDLRYTVWCAGERELFDLKTDPHELTNMYTSDSSLTFPSSPSPDDKIPIPTLVSRLDALLVVLKTCKGSECTHPWEALHPPRVGGSGGGGGGGGGSYDDQEDQDEDEGDSHGEVQSLKEALDPRFDGFYAKAGRVRWERCEEAYVRDSEGVEFGEGEGKGEGWGVGVGEGESENMGEDGFMWYEVATEL